MPEKVAKLWKDEWMRLERWVKNCGKEDHRWRVKTWDEGKDVYAHLECLECRERYGNVDACQNPKAITNVFTNFRSKHVVHKKHLDNYARRRGLPMDGLKASLKAFPIAKYDHEHHVKVGVEIVERLNVSAGGDVPVFTISPAPTDVSFKSMSYMYRVRCSVCTKLHTELCPKKLTLEHNLRTHLVSRDHLDALEQGAIVATLEARGGKRGRPKKADVRDLHPSQNSILKFFKEDGSHSGSSSGRGRLMDIDPGLSLLCWGLWSEFVKWQGPSMNVKGILHDQIGGNVWDIEPCASADVYNPSSDSIVKIAGLFRHKLCCRLSINGGGFRDLTCTQCASVTAENDFRGRVHREAEAIVKRGERTTSGGIRFGYLTHPEMRNQVREMNIALRKQQWLLKLQAQKVCALSTRKKKLEELLGVAADRKDLKTFLRHIVNGHRNGAFGGQEGIWDFLKDVARNLERKAKGFRYSPRTKAIAQAMLQFGGRQVAGCFARNLSGPSLTTLKRDRAKLPPFRTGLRKETFIEVAKVLSAAKESLGIVGHVPVIFAEDETRIKERPRWEAKYDTLIGFCGPSEEHICSFGLEVRVGEGDAGYEKIVSTFEQYTKGMYTRVVIVNPLHESMPKLALCAVTTCNKFTHEWVRKHWSELKSYWDQFCREAVGPLLGHASDGDARRRKLMLEDYRGQNSEHPRYSVGWEGWQYSVAILPNGDLYGFGDQDQPHNGKKLINPLDRVSSVLVLGEHHAAMSYVCTVYNQYPIHEHGLNWDDVNRTDRQNWAGPQRIAARRVQGCLHDLQERLDIRHERSLGTAFYLEVCGDYIDIFFSQRHDLRTRIVLASKVSWFLRLWRLWLKYGDHSVSGNVAKYTEKNMISIQAFHDVNMSCHFIVLLICAFRDKFSHLPVPFHLLGSDCCEIFFSKVGGMSGHERNYDFGSLLDSAVGLNRLASFEFGPEGLKVGRSHKKQDHVWGKIHPLADGESVPNLKDYSLVSTNDLVVDALKEGLDAAKALLSRLQMSPRSSLATSKRRWWTHPWVVEAETWPDKVVLNEITVVDDSEEDQQHASSPGPRVDGDFHEVEDPEEDLNRIDEWVTGAIEVHDNNSDELDEHPDLQVDNSVELETLGHEVRHVFGEVLHDLTNSSGPGKVEPTVTYEGRIIYKSKLVSELVGNPHLSKDRLTRVKQVLYYNTGKRKIGDVSPNACLVDVGSDCAVVFELVVDAAPFTRSSKPKKGKQKGKDPVVEPTIAARKGKGKSTIPVVQSSVSPKWEIWLGRVVMMRQKYHGQWGRVRSAIDLMDKPVPIVGQSGSICQFLFNWYKPVSKSRTQFTYDTTDLQWIDVESVISAVNLTLKHGIDRTYVLDAVDRQALDTYVQTLT